MMFRYFSKSRIIRLSCICSFLMLSACSGGDSSDLEQFIKEVKARPKEKIEELPENKTVEPFLFDLDGSRDPFRPVQKPDEETDEDDDSTGGKGIQPDFTRRKEELESYPLGSLAMVGSVKKDILWGLIKSEDGIQRVKVGNYMGENHGRIVEITETEIKLLEIIKDKKPKTWFEQSTSLPLKTEE